MSSGCVFQFLRNSGTIDRHLFIDECRSFIQFPFFGSVIGSEEIGVILYRCNRMGPGNRLYSDPGIVNSAVHGIRPIGRIHTRFLHSINNRISLWISNRIKNCFSFIINCFNMIPVIFFVDRPLISYRIAVNGKLEGFR